MNETRILQFISLLAEIANTAKNPNPPKVAPEPAFFHNRHTCRHHITPVNTEHVRPDARLTPDMLGVWSEKSEGFIYFELQGTAGKFDKIFADQIANKIFGEFEVMPHQKLKTRLENVVAKLSASVWRGMNRAYVQGYDAGKKSEIVKTITEDFFRMNPPNFNCANGGLSFQAQNAFKSVNTTFASPDKENISGGLGLTDKAVARIEKVLDEVFEKHENYADRMAELSECFIKPQEFAYACFSLGAQNEREKNYPPGPEVFGERKDPPQFPADMPLHVKQSITDFLEIAGDDLPAWMEAKIIKGEIPIAIISL